MWRERMREWKERFLGKVLLGFGFLLVGALSFEAGMLKESLKEDAPLIIRVPEVVGEAKPIEKSIGSVVSNTPTETVAPKATAPADQKCQYVGSKNSNKYHVPTSRCAKQIKPENLVCFADVSIATARGYVAGCLE